MADPDDDSEDSGVSDVAALWSDYKSTGSHDLRNQLVLQYSPLVKYVAGRVRSGLPPTVESNDLVSEGVIGLMDAIEKFDPGRGLQFQTYAVARIRGAIIDSLRAADWVPRTMRATMRDITRVQSALESSLGRTPTDKEVAAELKMSVAQLRTMYGSISSTGIGSLDELSLGDESTPRAEEPSDDGQLDSLLPAVRQLPERDQVIVALYYYEGLTLSEIGQVLQVSESRVSQLHTRATLALKAKVQAGALG